MSGHLTTLITVASVLVALQLAGCDVASAESDPCAKEKIAASKRNAPPSAIKQLHDCRNRQRAKESNPPPWLRDGGVRDEDEYVRVPCPPGMPRWRVCEKRRSEIAVSPDAGSRTPASR